MLLPLGIDIVNTLQTASPFSVLFSVMSNIGVYGSSDHSLEENSTVPRTSSSNVTGILNKDD